MADSVAERQARMASANSNQNVNDKLVIFKGDDTGGVFGRRLQFAIEVAEGADLTGCRAEWIFDGIVKAIDAPLTAGETREIFYSHNETERMCIGVRYGTFRIIDAEGKRATMTNTRAVEVTDNVARCYPGASAATVRIGTFISWENISGKPLLVKTVNGEAPDASGNINIKIEEPVLDDTVTEKSPNGVKSSGIWSWVKSLLPHWLTSDYAEPATVASVANKRDKSDLAVYSVTRTENTDWTWTSENKELEAALNEASVKPIYDSENHFWVITGTTHWGKFYYNSPGVYDVDALSVRLAFVTIPGYVDYYATASRPRYMDEETLGPEKPNQQLAAVATDDAAKPANGSLMKYDAANDRFVKATAGTDYADEATGTDRQVVRGRVFDETKWEISVAESEYAREADHAREAGLVMWSYVEAKPTTLSGYGITDGATKTELAGKRDLTDNVCRKTEFTEWICNPPRTEFGGVYSVRYDSPVKVYSLFDNEEVVEEIYSPTDDKLNLEFVGYCTATRSAVCTEGKKFVTSDVVDGKVSSAVSTNNPAFVSAVQNTPAPEPGQGEDPPWGTWGTVGAAIAGLVAGLKWLKDKVFDSAGNIQDQFATDLLGKQVAKEAIIYKANTATGLKDRAFNALSLDGTEYNLSTALAAVTPTVENQPRDLLIVATATASTTISFTAGTIKGDKPTIDGAGTWLITLTEYAANTWYCRQIKMEDAA